MTYRTAKSRYKKDLNQAMQRQRSYCGRHRLHYATWNLVNGKLVPARCWKCDPPKEQPHA